MLDWATSVDGLTKEELAVIIYPQETHPNGAPTNRAVHRIATLAQRLRRHPMSEGMAIFSIPRKVTVFKPNIGTSTQIAWFLRNVMKKSDWDIVRARLVKMVNGYRGTIKRYDVVIQEAPNLRKTKIAKAIEEMGKVLEDTGGHLKTEPTNTNGKKKKKKIPESIV